MKLTRPEYHEANVATEPNVSRLLTLPRELRDLIYQYTLIEPIRWDRKHAPGCYHLNLDPSDAMTGGQRCACSHRRGINLLYVNKTVYREATVIFYQDNTFAFGFHDFWQYSSDRAKRELQALTKLPLHLARLIRHVSILFTEVDSGDDDQDIDLERFRYFAPESMAEVVHTLSSRTALLSLELPASWLLKGRMLRHIRRMRNLREVCFVHGACGVKSSEIKFWCYPHRAHRKRVEDLEYTSDKIRTFATTNDLKNGEPTGSLDFSAFVDSVRAEVCSKSSPGLLPKTAGRSPLRLIESAASEPQGNSGAWYLHIRDRGVISTERSMYGLFHIGGVVTET